MGQRHPKKIYLVSNEVTQLYHANMENHMKESTLRDLIAQNIEKLKPGLTLLQKEQYIPNEHGTKSFIDLYATDKRNRHILIELKRSTVSARQAIHEVNKYVESVKQYFGAKDSEVHVIIASTEWTELIIPFSRLCSDAGFSIEGIQIDITEDPADFQVLPILPLPIKQGRFLAPWHNVYWYADLASFQQGIDAIENAYSQKGIDDYVIVKFHLPDTSMTVIYDLIFKDKETDIFHAGKTPDLPQINEYIAYTAVQILSTDKCLQIISHDEDALAEAQEKLPDMDDEEALCYLHECVEAIAPSPKCDNYEIGYPAKFSHLFKHENCTPLGIVRHGIFARNAVLNDDTIYSELQGEDGSTGAKFKKNVRISNHAHVKALKEDITSALKTNPVWQSHILRIIDEVESEFPDSEIDISIFNPCTGIFTIYYTLTQDNGFLYLPGYHILVKNPVDTRMYFGALETDSPAKTFSQLLAKYYDGSLDVLLISLTWGGRDERDSDIVEDLGAQYRSYYANISDGKASDYFTLREYKWRPCEPTSPFDLFLEYAEKNSVLVNQIISKIQPHYHYMGAFFDSNNVDASLEKYVDMATAKERQIYYSDAPEICDLCKCPLSDEKFMIDGKIKDHYAWANMCAECFYIYGVKIGWGYGQLYMRDANGWLLVGGFCPDEEM